VKLVADLSNLSELSYLEKGNGAIRIGALTRISDLAESRVLNGRHEALRHVCQTLASPPIRNLATVGGNIGASGSHRDLLSVLIATDAKAVLKNIKGSRVVTIEDLLLEDGRVDIRAGEIITEIFFRELPPHSWCSFGKVGRRLSFVVPLVSLAVFVELDTSSRRISNVRLSFNHLRGDIPKRARQAEAALRNEILNEPTIATACQVLSAELRPAGDFKASSEYRRRTATRLFEDQLGHCAEIILGRSG